MTNAERVLSGFSRNDCVPAIEAEILREKAEALGQAGLRLERALDALVDVREAIDGIERRLQGCSGSPEEMASLREAHSDLTARWGMLRDRAQQAYQYLTIHREAVGFRNHHDLERCYKVSETLR